MEDTGELTFQAQGDTRLSTALIRRLLFRVWGLITLGLLAVATLLVRAEVVTATDVALPGAIVLCVMLDAVWRVSRKTVQQNAHKLGRPTAYRIDDIGIHATAGFGTEILPWSTITGVAPVRGQIILWRGWRQAFGIPSGGLSPAEQDRLLEVLRSHGRALRPPTPQADPDRAGAVEQGRPRTG